MTLVAVWRFGEHRIHAVADTRISRDEHNVLTDHGPKILPITMVCKIPGKAGWFDQEAFRIEYGFAFAGATLPALSAHALGNVLCGNLVGKPDAPIPSMENIARLIGSVALEYIREIGQLAGGQGGFFESILFGHCPVARLPLAFKFKPAIEQGSIVLKIERHELDDTKVVTIGTNPELLQEEITRIRNEKPHSIVFADAPMHALRKFVKEGTIGGVGGMLQQAWSIPYQVQIVATTDGIQPRPPSPRNAGLFVLGFDILDMQQVGSFQIAMAGR